MAKNYTFAEAVKIINEGTDLASITDIGRRYPVLLHKVTKITAKAGEEFVDLMGYMPEYLTANKVNTALKNAVGEVEESDADDASEATEVEETAEANEGTDNYDSMNATEIWKLMCERGLDKTVKSKKKGDRIAALREYDKNGGAAAETDEAETDEATNDDPYAGKSAMELFKECKKRGIKAAPKKPARFYADLLMKADAEAAEATEDESDDWDEDEAPEEEAPKKPAKKAEATEKKAPAKKAAKKEETTDDDDDWDI